MANSHRRYNAIEVLHSKGNFLSERSNIKSHIVQFFDHLVIKPLPWKPKVDGLIFDTIDQSCVDWLERMFERKRCLMR